MRHIAKRRNVAFAASVVGAGYLATFVALGLGPERPVLFGLAIAALITILYGLTAAGVYHAAARKRTRLLRGERLLAKWTLPEAVWSHFRDQQAARTGIRRNLIRVREDRERHGVPVVITEESLMVEDDFYDLGELRELNWHETAPPYFDFLSVSYTKRGPIYWNLRVPASADDPAGMRRIWDYFQARLISFAPASRVPRIRLMRRISVALIPIGVVAAVVAKLFYALPEKQTTVVVALIIAMTALPLGVLVGGMSHWWLTRGPGRPPS